MQAVHLPGMPKAVKEVRGFPHAACVVEIGGSHAPGLHQL